MRVSGPIDPTREDVALMRDQGFTGDLLIVDVRNVGRLAVSVESVTSESEDGWGFGVLADPQNPALPFRLEPGAKETWHVDLAPMQMLVDGDGKARRVFMRVELGTGQVLRTKESSPVAPSESAPAPAGRAP